jgi:transposase
MPQAYSNDLRRKFLEAQEAGEGTLKELAKRFRVSWSWGKKISARRTRTGEINAPRWRHGPVSRVTAGTREWMREQIRRQPDLTLRELQERLEQAQQVGLSLGWIWVVLRQLGLALKKNRSMRRSRIAKKRSGVGRSGGKRWPQ